MPSACAFFVFAASMAKHGKVAMCWSKAEARIAVIGMEEVKAGRLGHHAAPTV